MGYKIEREALPVNYKETPNEVKERISELRSQGYLIREIASELGISSSVVRRHLNPEYASKYRETRRLNRGKTSVMTTVNGKHKRLYGLYGRRAKPNTCEVCSKAGFRISWHHWDPEDLLKGLWVCTACHSGIRFVDMHLVETYLRLRSQVEGNGHK